MQQFKISRGPDCTLDADDTLTTPRFNTLRFAVRVQCSAFARQNKRGQRVRRPGTGLLSAAAASVFEPCTRRARTETSEKAPARINRRVAINVSNIILFVCVGRRVK